MAFEIDKPKDISKKMFDMVYEYNSENTKYTIEPAIIEYFAKE